MVDLTGPLLKEFNAYLGHPDAIIILGLVSARLLIVISLVPFLGSKNAPGPTRIGLGIFTALLLWPSVTASINGPLPTTALTFSFMMIKEVFIGFLIGFITAQIFYAVEMCGQLIDVTRGINQVQLLIPELQERSSGFGTFYYQLMLVIYLASNLHAVFFHVLAESFQTLPINQMPFGHYGWEPFFNLMHKMFADIFLIAFTLAIPIAAVCLLIDMTFGLINRVAPQINAYFMSLPAKALGGVVIALAAFNMTIKQFSHYSGVLLETLVQSVELFR